jgi:hypothetical protein
MNYYVVICLLALVIVRLSGFTPRAGYSKRPDAVQKHMTGSAIKTLVFSTLLWILMTVGALKDNVTDSALSNGLYFALGSTLIFQLLAFLIYTKNHGDRLANALIGEPLTLRAPLTWSPSNVFFAIGLYGDLMLAAAKLRPSPVAGLVKMVQRAL